MDFLPHLSPPNQTPEGGNPKEEARKAVVAADATVLTRYLPLVTNEPGPSHLVLTLDDVLPRIPTQCLQPGMHDPDREPRFALRELSAGIARGRVTVKLSSLASRYPDVFAAPKSEGEDIPVFLPLQKLMLQIGQMPASPISAPAIPAAHPPAVAAPVPRPPAAPAREIPVHRQEPPPPEAPPSAPIAAAPPSVPVETPRAALPVAPSPDRAKSPPEDKTPAIAPASAPPTEADDLSPEPEAAAPSSFVIWHSDFEPPPPEAAASPPPEAKRQTEEDAAAGADPSPSRFENREGEDILTDNALADRIADLKAALEPSGEPAQAAAIPPPSEGPCAAAPAPEVAPPPSTAEPEPAAEPLVTSSPPTAEIPLAAPSESSLPLLPVAESPLPNAAPAAESGASPLMPPPPPAPVPSQTDSGHGIPLRIAAGLPHVRPPLLTRFGPQLPPRDSSPEPPAPVAIPRPVFAASAPEHKPAEPDPAPVPAVQPPPLFAAKLPETPASAPSGPPPPAASETITSPAPPAVGTSVSGSTASSAPAPPKPSTSFPRAFDAAALKFEQEPLQAIFMTDETLDLAKISKLSAEFPGLSGCMLVVGESVASGGERPDGLDGKTLRELSRQLSATVGAFSERLPADPTFTLYGGNRALTIFSRDQFCLCVVHQNRGFMPGVRERLTAVADSLARTLPTLGA